MMDAWSVWLASGLTLGLLLVLPRSRWLPVVAGAAAGAAIFSWIIAPGAVTYASGYAALEVIAALAGAWAAGQVGGMPMRLDSPRQLAAVVVGAIVLALVGAGLATAWSVAAGGQGALATFAVWALSNIVGVLLVAPVIVTWAGFRVKRSGGLPMPQFIAGAIACVLFLGSLQILFGGISIQRFSGSIGTTLTYPPILFIAVVALMWGARGASLAAFAGALIALFDTVHGKGPFASIEGFLGEANLEVQGYAVVVALTGLLIAVLAARERNAWRAARDWRTRFEAAIGAHRLVAYEWDPVSNALVVTGDTAALIGIPASRIATLADWMAGVAPEDRDSVATAFALRAEGAAAPALRYRIARGDGVPVTLVDEAQAIHDHDGTLYRVTGLVRAV